MYYVPEATLQTICNFSSLIEHTNITYIAQQKTNHHDQ